MKDTRYFSLLGVRKVAARFMFSIWVRFRVRLVSPVLVLGLVVTTKQVVDTVNFPSLPTVVLPWNLPALAFVVSRLQDLVHDERAIRMFCRSFYVRRLAPP